MLGICDFNTFYSPNGGGVRQYLEQKYVFYRNRNDARYVAIVPGEENSVRREGLASWYTIKAHRFFFASNYRWLASIGELRRILRIERPDLVEVGAPYLSPLMMKLASKGLGCRFVAFWHADYPDTYVVPTLKPLGGTISGLGGRLAWAYARATIGRYDAVFAASTVIANKLRSHGMNSVYRTPLGVDTVLFSPARRSRVEAVSGRPEEPRRILYMGRLGPEKGLATLLEAYPRLVAEYPQLQLWIIGHGPLQDQVRRMKEVYSSIRWLGYSDDREAHARLIADSAVSVTPGGLETFSLTTLEALSCGTPVVCADEGAAAELVIRSGNGTLFRTGDARDLSRAVLSVLAWSSDKRRIHAEMARQFVLTHHHWTHVLEVQLDRYRQVMATPIR